MSSLVTLFSIVLRSALANVLVDNKPTPQCVDVCLAEPSCKNEVLSKFKIGFFLIDEVNEVDTIVETEIIPHDPNNTYSADCCETVYKTVSESYSSDQYVALNIIKVNERRDACCTSNSVVVTFIKSNIKQTHEYGYLILTPKSDFTHSIPHIFATTFNRFAGIEQAILQNNHQMSYKIPLKDIENLIISITDLGIANIGAYQKNNQGLDVYLESDIFTHGPYIGFVPYFQNKYALPSAYKLPDNTMLRLANIHNALKTSIKVPCVPKYDLVKMSVDAFINEIRFLFSCDKPCTKKVEKTECERTIVDYCIFVTSCIKVIACCEQKVESCVFVQSNTCNESDRYTALANCINTYASSCNIPNVQVSNEVNLLFSEVCPSLDVCGCDSNTLVPMQMHMETKTSINITESDSCESDSGVSGNTSVQKKKKKVAVETSTTVSTYGWYVAGGVVAVSVAVAVYIFVL